MSSLLVSILLLFPIQESESGKEAQTQSKQSEVAQKATEENAAVEKSNGSDEETAKKNADKSTQTRSAQEKTSEKPADEYLLRYKFEKGETAYYEVKQKIVRTSNTGPRQEVVKEAVYEKKHLLVTDTKPDGSFLVTTIFDHVKMAAIFPSGSMKFDSRKPRSEDPPGYRSFRKSIEKPEFKVWFAPTGKQKSVVRLRRNKKAEPTPKGVKKKTEPVNSTHAAKDADGSGFLVIFPDKPIKVGDTWRREYTVKVSISKEIKRRITILRTYRLNAVEGGIAKISFASSLKTRAISPPTLAQLAQTRPSGTVEFHMETGRILSRTMKIDDTVLNHSGPNSMLQTVSNRSEQQVAAPVDRKTAKRD